MAEAEAHSLGDRLERALEPHADTVGEIERGERAKPHNLRRNVLLAAAPVQAARGRDRAAHRSDRRMT